MSVDPLEYELHRWHEAKVEQLLADSRRCADGPTLSALYLHLTGEAPLPADQLCHVEQCAADCQRRWGLIEAEVRGSVNDPPKGYSPQDSQREPAPAIQAPALVTPRITSLRDKLLRLRTRRWPAWGGITLAASILLALLFVTITGKPAFADARLEAAFRLLFVPPGDLEVLEGPVLDARLKEIKALGEERDRAKRAFVSSFTDANGKSDDHELVMQPWDRLYRGYRQIGYWRQALNELHEAIAFCEDERWCQPLRVRHWICLTDLGDTYAALGQEVVSNLV